MEQRFRYGGEMRCLTLIRSLLCLITVLSCHARPNLIDVKSGPDSVIWVVQLSDLHFSVHHPDRALDFKRLVGPALSIINPSLVLITGDLTDGKSKDLLTMKQIEEEWVEYQNVLEDVVERSGLNKSIFYDLRGNHDNFGVPVVGGSFDFFSKYSINGQLGRSRNVNSVIVQAGEQKHLFVGFDSTTSVGVRGPTNLFGHPTDHLLIELESEFSKWNSVSTKPDATISFGHFPLSFSAAAGSGKSLKDVFLKHSLSVYLCGHLHTRFGKNLKRHHMSSQHFLSSQKLFQLNIHQKASRSMENCSLEAPPVEEFWEWEMGDWRKSRAMRILAIDRGHISYVDINFKSGAKKTIILPTFPLDSRFMSTSSSHRKYLCQYVAPLSYKSIRALIFSVSPIVSVLARIYDSSPGELSIVMEAYMSKHDDNTTRGDLYFTPWNFKAFEDSSPDRYWLQIEATDITGRSSLTELRPFSVNGLSVKPSWTWTEFLVMGCQWDALYYPILWSALYFMFAILLIPKVYLLISKTQYTYKNFIASKGVISGVAWVLLELCRDSVIWYSYLGYLMSLILLPWFHGNVFTDGGERGYMTYMGWVVRNANRRQNHEYIGSPDIMVVVIPHLIFVVLPSILMSVALAAEKEIYREHFLTLSGKKEDDYGLENERSLVHAYRVQRSSFLYGGRRGRKILLVICLAICWKHFMNCRVVIRAYDMNIFLHFPVYSFYIPLMLAYTVYKTNWVSK